MSEINVSVGGGPGVVVSVAGDGTTATVTTGGTVNVTLTESNPTWSGIAGKPSTFPPQAHSHFIADTVGLQAALNEKADLDAGGKVPASQLPSYVDDVLEFANLAALPATGETGKIYVTTGNGKIYRWSGTTYIEISAAPGSTDFVPEGTGNLYHTTARAAAAAPVQSVAGRTGAVTLVKADVGLGNVDNTADASKPVSTAQAAADAAVASAAAADATSKANAAQAAAVQRANHTGTQAIATVDGLQTALDGKAAASHSHAIADVTGLQSALDGKQASGSYAAASHTHPISDVTGLQTALDGKQASGAYAAASHGHDAATTSAAGFLSAAGKSKLDGIASGATANATDAQLRDRSTHTGTQAAATISDFASAVVAAAPPTTNASLLTSGTVADARLSASARQSIDNLFHPFLLAGM